MDHFNPSFVSAKGSCATVTHSAACKSLIIVDYVIYYQLQDNRQVSSSVKAFQTSLFLQNLFKGPLYLILSSLYSNTVNIRQQPRGFAE